MRQSYYARGKLLLTSEFMILHGSKALAVPLVVGQSLTTIPKKHTYQLHWKALFNKVPWFETTLTLEDFEVIHSTNREMSDNLVFMLQKLLETTPGFMDKIAASDVETDLEFNPAFGFGSSSTLTSLLAQWADTDPMQLHFNISKGSGYDVACADSEQPIVYQLINDMPVIEKVDYAPPYLDKMWLVYLGKKQVSGNSVRNFLDHYSSNDEDVQYFTFLTHEFYTSGDMHEAGEIMMAHENKLSSILNQPTLKEKRFPDLDGYCKSLGAWGGDYALILTEWDEERLKAYMESKKIDQVYAFEKLALLR